MCEFHGTYEDCLRYWVKRGIGSRDEDYVLIRMLEGNVAWILSLVMYELKLGHGELSDHLVMLRTVQENETKINVPPQVYSQLDIPGGLLVARNHKDN